MTKRKWWIALFIVSHGAVAAATWLLTWLVLRSSGPIRVPPERDGARSAEVGRFAKFAKDIESFGAGGESEVRQHLLFVLQSFEDLPADDLQLIVGMKPESVGERQLLELDSVRTFLDGYARNSRLDPLSFTSRKYHPLIAGLFVGTEQTPQRVMVEHKRLLDLSSAFLTLRKVACDLPTTDVDNRLVFLEMMRDLKTDAYLDVKPLSSPKIPLFNDGEGKVLFALEGWLNSPYAKKAIPIENFGRLYREGKIVPLSSAFVQYRD